jgi:hypothetical protein
MLELIGGPLVILSGIGVIFDVIEAGGAVQAIATIREFIWELSISIYLIAKGYKTSSPVLAGTGDGTPLQA